MKSLSIISLPFPTSLTLNNLARKMGEKKTENHLIIG
jgi:hypothetical protein